MNHSISRSILSLALLAAVGFSTSQSYAQFGGFDFPVQDAIRVIDQIQGHRHHQHQQPVYRYPEYQQPVYQQPIYQNPGHHQPGCRQPIITYPVAPPVFVTPQPPVTVKPQPVVTRKPALAPNVLKARQLTQQAQAHFQKKEYLSAVKLLDQVCELLPKDTNAFQFRSLAKFASFEFQGAAADAYDSLTMGNTWNRKIVDSIYGTKYYYQNHLADLQAALKNEPTMTNHFLMAYHHLVAADYAAGERELVKVLELQPNEPVSTKLLAAVRSKLNSTTAQK